MNDRRIKVGVVGAGLIAQVMHLHYLRELADRFEVVGLCDIVGENAERVARRFGIGQTFTEWQALLEQPLDAVLVATSGDHAPIAIEAARRGMHVFVEKPMCYSTADGQRMVDAAEGSQVTLMVGYQKRYDLAYLRFRDEIAAISDPRLMHVSTLESPYWAYVAHYDTVAPLPPPADAVARLRAGADAAVTQAIGDATEFERMTYENVLLASFVHELNALRGLLGEPDVLEHASLRVGSLSLVFRFGDLPVTVDRIDLPGISRYRMDFALYAPERRITLSFPSPFLRSEPTLLISEDGAPGTTRSSTGEEIVSFESAFKLELIAFHESVTTGTAPRTSGADVLHDIALCQSIIDSSRAGRPIDRPSQVR